MGAIPAPRTRSCWLSCDVTDTDATHFWTAVATALRTFDPAIGIDALDLLDAEGDLGHDAIASLVNDLFLRDGEHMVVIGPCNFAGPLGTPARSPSSLIGCPRYVHVVLRPHPDPDLPLHRWRAAGRLGEIRVAEAAPNQRRSRTPREKRRGRDLTEDAAILTERTEGWAAGVQLAALSMRHETDPSEFVHNFAGTDRNVADFLLGEVLGAPA